MTFIISSSDPASEATPDPSAAFFHGVETRFSNLWTPPTHNHQMDHTAFRAATNRQEDESRHPPRGDSGRSKHPNRPALGDDSRWRFIFFLHLFLFFLFRSYPCGDFFFVGNRRTAPERQGAIEK
jgi:hypothetical protein